MLPGVYLHRGMDNLETLDPDGAHPTHYDSIGHLTMLRIFCSTVTTNRGSQEGRLRRNIDDLAINPDAFIGNREKPSFHQYTHGFRRDEVQSTNGHSIQSFQIYGDVLQARAARFVFPTPIALSLYLSLDYPDLLTPSQSLHLVLYNRTKTHRTSRRSRHSVRRPRTIR